MNLVRLRALPILALLAASFITSIAHAEIPELIALREKLVTNTFFIRGHNPETDIHWKLQDGTLVTPEPKYHMVTVLQVSKLKLSGKKLRIEGTRRTFQKLPDGKYGVSSANGPMKMEVDLDGADLASVLPTVPQMIFYRNEDEALEHTPLHKHSPATAAPDKQIDEANSVCDCSEMKSDACLSKNKHKTDGLTEPKLLHSVVPEYSEEARRAKVNGSTEIYFIVGVDGHPADLWLINPLGYGLDKEAIDAANQYVFRPAACHGNPVPVDLYMDIRFQIF